MRDSREDQLAAGREALQRHAWREAFEQLRGADTAEPLPPEDLELLTSFGAPRQTSRSRERGSRRAAMAKN